MNELYKKTKEELIALIEKLQQSSGDKENIAPGDFDAMQISFDQLAQTSSSAILIYKKNCVCYVNQAASSLTGYCKEELLKMKFWEIIHPDYQKKLSDRGMSRLEGKNVESRYDIPILTKNGETRWVDYSANKFTIGDESVVLGVAVDITEKVDAFNTLSLDKEQLDITLRSIGDGVITTDINGNITMINKTTEILTGWTQSEAIGKRIQDVFNIVNEYTRIPCENPVEKVIKTGNIVGLANHTALISRNGESRIISDSAAPITDKTGKIVGIVLVFHDNTEQKHTEDNLRESAEKYRTLFESSNDAIFLLDNYLFSACNIKACEIYNAPLDDLIGKSPVDYSPEFQENGELSTKSAKEKITKAINGEPQFFKWTHRKKTGELFDCEISLIRVNINKKFYIQAIVRDVTLTKKAEKALTESENLLHNIIDTANIAMAIVGFDGTIEYINKQAVKTFGYEHEDIPTMDKWWVLAYPEENYRKKVVDQYMGLVYKAIEGDKEIERREYFTTCKDGSIKAMVIFGVIVNDKVFVMFEDITERKRMEEELQSSEELYRTTFENTGTATVLIEEDSTISFANAKFENLSKCTKKEIEGKRKWTEFVHKDDLIRMQEQHRLRRENREAALKQYEFRFIAKDGEIRNIFLTVDLIPETKKSVASLLDVTERKHEEDALRESEKKYRSLIETTDTGYVIINDQGKVLDANTKYVSLAGYDTLDEILNRNVLEWTSERAKTQNADAIKLCSEQGFIRNFETEYIQKNGKIIPVEINATVVKTGSGNIILTLTNDISERKNAENTLLKSQQLFKTLAEVAPVGVFRTRTDGYTTYVNPKWCELSGLSYDEALGDGWLKAVHPDDRKRILENWGKDTASNRQSLAEYRFLKNDGSVVWVMGNAVPEWNDGEIIGYIGTITDITERIKSEQSLKESEEKFRLLYTSMDQAVTLNEIITDDKGNPVDYRIIEANPSFEIHTGLKISEVVGKNILSILPNTEKFWIDVFGETALTGKSQRIDNYSSELKRYFDFYIYSPKKGQFALVSTDITERKKEERQKELNKVRLESVLRLNNMLPMPVSEIITFALESAVKITESSIGYLAFVNEDETMLRMHSWSKQAMEECNVENKYFDFEVRKTGLWGEAIRQRKSIITNNFGEKNELKKGLPNGHVALSNHLNVPVFDEEKIVLLIGVGNKPYDYDDADIRQLTLLLNSMWSILNRKKVVEALRESEKRYRIVTDNSKDIITKFNAQGRITFISPACLNLLGYKPEELLGERIFSLFHPEDIPYLREYQHLLIDAKTTPNLIKHRLRKSDGDYLWFETNNQILYTPETNEILEIVAVSRDISEIIKVEEFRKAKEAAEFANKAKSDFLANMSHEIRNPMNAIVGLTNSLDRMDLPELQQEIVRSLKISSSSLLNILNDILDFSKIEANKTDLSEINFSLDDVINEVHSIFRAIAEQKKILFSTELKQKIPPFLRGDAVKLKQILVNLCGNAIKFTEHGKVSLEVSVKSVTGNDVVLEFNVIDTGIGIKQQDFEKLFSSFTQLDSSTTKTFSGTGLGLAIVKKYLELMNGTISVSSQIGVGSTFTFTLPLKIVSEKEKIITTKKNLINTKMKLKILLAEDDGINQMYLKSFLNDQGWEVDTAFNGVQALEKFDKSKYDVILMDGQMPKMDGFDATRTIREREKVTKTHTPIIAITGYAVSGDKEKFLDAGMDDYISKPVNETALIEVILKHVSSES